MEFKELVETYKENIDSFFLEKENYQNKIRTLIKEKELFVEKLLKTKRILLSKADNKRMESIKKLVDKKTAKIESILISNSTKTDKESLINSVRDLYDHHKKNELNIAWKDEQEKIKKTYDEEINKVESNSIEKQNQLSSSFIKKIADISEYKDVLENELSKYNPTSEELEFNKKNDSKFTHFFYSKNEYEFVVKGNKYNFNHYNIARNFGKKPLFILHDFSKGNLLNSIIARLINLYNISNSQGTWKLNINDYSSNGKDFLKWNTLQNLSLSTENELINYIVESNKLILDRNKKFYTSEINNIYQYNQNNPKNEFPFQLDVFYNMDIDDSKFIGALKQILSFPSQGLFSLFVIDTNLSDLSIINKLKKEDVITVLDISTNELTPSIRPIDFGNTIDINLRINSLSESTNSGILPFSDYIPLKNEWHKFTSENRIKIPIGKSGKSDLFFELNQETENQCILIGQPGAGKSTLLHNIILNIMVHYSPSEVELILVDFKDGVEFKIYAEKKAGHCKHIGLKAEKEYRIPFITYLHEKMLERFKLFNNIQGKHDLSSYRNVTGIVIPRTIIIIDEFQKLITNLNEDEKQTIQDLFIDILQRGRSAGIHFILATQTFQLPGSTSDRVEIPLNRLNKRLLMKSDDSDKKELLGIPTYEGKTAKVRGEVNIDNYDSNNFGLTYAVESKDISYVLENNPINGDLLVFNGSLLPEFNNVLIKNSTALSFGKNIDIFYSDFSVNLTNDKNENILINGGQKDEYETIIKTLFKNLGLFDSEIPVWTNNKFDRDDIPRNISIIKSVNDFLNKISEDSVKIMCIISPEELNIETRQERFSNTLKPTDENILKINDVISKTDKIKHLIVTSRENSCLGWLGLDIRSFKHKIILDSSIEDVKNILGMSRLNFELEFKTKDQKKLPRQYYLNYNNEIHKFIPYK